MVRSKLRTAPHIIRPMPKPSDLGFDPERFPSYRPQQYEAIEAALAGLDKYDLFAIDAPVGSGKSLTNMAIAKLWRAKALASGAEDREAAVVILTATKALQDQYQHDFRGHVADMRGMANYECRGLNERFFPIDIVKRFKPDPRVRATCDQGPCLLRVECELRNDGCHYFDALRHAKHAPITVPNYAYWQLGALGSVGLVICDEAHLLRNQLDNAARLEHADLPRLSFERTKEWALERLRSMDDKTASIAREREKGVLSRLSTMTGEWVFDPGYAGDDKGRGSRAPSWSPVTFHDEGDALANSGTKFIFTSGTLTEDHVLFFRRSVRCKNLTWDMVSYKSTFPVQNRRVILSTALGVSGKGVAVKYTMPAQDKAAHLAHCIALVKAMDPARRKGIVHGVSYVRAKEFKEALIASGVPKELVYFPRFSQETKKAIEDFKARPAGGIIISPSLSTGYDFPADLCRWQLVLKVPFPDTQSPLMQARTEADKDYGVRIAMETLAQMAGRGSRSQDDWCETYIADASIRWALFRPGAAPRILKESFVEIAPGIDGLRDWLKRRGAGK